MDRQQSAADTEATTVTVEVLHTGSVAIDRSLAYEEETSHPTTETGRSRPDETRVWVPVSTYLIEHPEGTVLVDAGWHHRVRTDERGHLGRVLASMHDTRLPPGDAVDEQLAERGLAAADLAAVVVTHLHPDHVSGLDLVRDAPRILVSEPELASVEERFSLPRRLAGHMWEGVELEPFVLERTGIGPRERSFDLFGDGSVHLAWVPGHSEGQVAVLARTADGLVLLASDAVYGKRNLEDGVPPGSVTDRDAAIESLSWIREIASREDCLAVLPNHDPDVNPGLVREGS